MSNDTFSDEHKILGRDLSQSSRGTLILRTKNGYLQPGRILELVPVITDPNGLWLTTIEWAETPASAAYIAQSKIAFDTELTISTHAVTKAVPGTAAATLLANPDKYISPPEGRKIEVFETELTQSGGLTRAKVESAEVRAEELHPSDIGQNFSNADEDSGVNYQIKLLNYRVVSGGPRPGVTVWLRHGALESRPAYENDWHVRMDHLFNFVTLTPQA
ncbi:hypothetical protein [Nocardia higoensis]|uniref:hypothetical protein n=1 Tax=Nocardia higoensis TaxID=228599 RepID=UPI0012F625DE|nr:hypothetical protein [Nocardia higoensis]